MKTAGDPLAQAVLDFWFLAPGTPGYGRPRPEWFRKDAAFDAVIRARFGTLIAAALAGTIGWSGVADRLALILLLDQFTRNVFRDGARAFAGDAAALHLAEAIADSGDDQALAPVQRWFAYMPFMHAESLPAQQRCVALFDALNRASGGQFPSPLASAIRHRDIVARFGRFPHRNAILGRDSTAEERAFLRQPGASF